MGREIVKLAPCDNKDCDFFGIWQQITRKKGEYALMIPKVKALNFNNYNPLGYFQTIFFRCITCKHFQKQNNFVEK
ncbi:unnamed protein product [marine sediment metagenome]|uniref:Uncharacterized protein n=1 Tax=marine sediment metagenome TaxID=412755 RepID=X1AW65_9ZZZZ